MSIEIQTQGANPWDITFTRDGRHIVCGGNFSNGPTGWLRRWQVSRDSWEVGTAVSTTVPVYAVSTSKNGLWLLHDDGEVVVVRDATTNEEVFRVEGQTSQVVGIDISANSRKFGSISLDGTLRIFSIATGQNLLPTPLQNGSGVAGVKFSPHGEYIANTLGRDRIRIWDANTSNQLSEINLGRTGGNFFYGSSPLAWSSDSKRLFVVTADGVITCLEVSPFLASTSKLAEWTVPVKHPGICSLATNGRNFIACSTPSSISFWNIASYTQIGSTLEFQDQVRTIALSSDDSYLACGRSGGITIYSLRDILPREILLDPTSHLPLMEVSDVAYKPWINKNAGRAQAILSREINTAPSYHSYVNRALVRTHLKQWDLAIQDAKKSLSIQHSPIARIAHAVALVGKGEKLNALQIFDLAFLGCDTNETGLLLLIKAVFLFVSGERQLATSRVNDLIDVVDDTEKYNHHNVLGVMYQKQGDTRRANQSFELAQSFSFLRQGFHLVTISLIFGKAFDVLKIKD